VHLIDNPEATVADLMQFIKGPDFPTGGVIHGTERRKMYETGRGLSRCAAGGDRGGRKTGAR
jgi:DNA gyrase/topoisomerase IV subunit A